MAEDSEKRFQKIMDKLYYSPKPKAMPKPSPSSGGGMSSLQKGRWAESSSRRNLENVPRRLGGSIGSREVAPQSCRPWDRGDLMRRLSTFKAMTWFGKPKAVSPVNCARRGWVNVEMDTIACEACGARLLFSSPSSWTLQQVEKAAAVFSLKLDNGHKLLCPWIDNICDETLALFPPTPAPALVEGYKDRCSAFLRLSALPIVSSSAIDHMWSSQLEHFLAQPTGIKCILDNGIRLTDSSISEELASTSEAVTASLYNQAHKIISLCGWEPRLLPYVVDPKDQSSQSVKNAQPSESSAQRISNYSIIIHSSPGSGEVEEETNNQPLLEHEPDPASVVLDCRLCGACVGLWAFTAITRPLECFSLIESPDAIGQNECATCDANLASGAIEASSIDSFSTGDHNSKKGIVDYCCNVTASKERSSSLNLTIAGGPPPTKQNFIPRVSLPIISRHLRGRFGSKFDVRNHMSSTVNMNQVNIQCSTKSNDSSKHQDDSTGSFLVVREEIAETLKRKRNEVEFCNSSDTNLNAQPHLNGKNPNDCMQKKTDDLGRNDHCSQGVESEGSLNSQREAGIGYQVGGNPCVTADPNVTIAGAETCEKESLIESSDAYNQLDGGLPGVNTLCGDVNSQNGNDNSSPTEHSSATNASVNSTCEVDMGDVNKASANDQKVNALKSMVLSSVNGKVVKAHMSGTNPKPACSDNTSEFDPIRQHRPFCPWIASSDGEHLPGWKLTLSALEQERDSSHVLLLTEAPSTPSDELEDPITSVRRLFTSPPSKRFKATH